LPDGQVNTTASESQASEEGPDPGAFTISRLGDTTETLDVFFTLSGTATFGDDYSLSHTSPVTIPAGQGSVTLTLTPIDDSIFGEQEESAILTIMENPGYPIGLATATITISDNDNRAPSVEAGGNQAAELAPATTVPGLYYGTVPGNIALTTPNPETQILVDPSAQTENSIAGNTTEIYTGNIYDADGQISFTEYIDDKSRIWIDGNLVLSDDNYRTRTSTVNLDLAPGWHTIEIRISNGSGGSGPVGGEIGIGYHPDGGTNWQTLTDPGDGSFLKVGQINPLEVSLSGTANDLDDDPLTTTWTRESGPGPVTFGDVSALSTTASFTEAGTYTLRLTVNDGYDTRYDELTVTVVGSGASSDYATWIAGHDVGGQTHPEDDYDGDGISNAVENYFGTSPGTANKGLAADGVSFSGNTTFTFTHPISDTPATDIAAAYKWSTDLVNYHASGATINGTTVTFAPGTPASGEVTVTATIEGTEPDKIFVTVEVTQN